MSMLDDSNGLSSHLNQLPLNKWEFKKFTYSTNDDALAWAEAGAPDFSLVIADKQLRGRGRAERKWVTNPGSSLAFSLILRPETPEIPFINRFVALPALSLACVLKEKYQKTACLKWPNDVLIDGAKVSGILMECTWQNDLPTAIIIGMGINVNQGSVPNKNGFNYPATSIEATIGEPVNRWDLLSSIILNISHLRTKICSPDFISEWNDHLAFKGEWVRLSAIDQNQEVKVLGISDQGYLEIEDHLTKRHTIEFGEILHTYTQ